MVRRGVDVFFLPFDLIKAGATQTETSLLKQYVAGVRVDLLDAHQSPSLTSTAIVTTIARPIATKNPPLERSFLLHSRLRETRRKLAPQISVYNQRLVKSCHGVSRQKPTALWL